LANFHSKSKDRSTEEDDIKKLHYLLTSIVPVYKLILKKREIQRKLKFSHSFDLSELMTPLLSNLERTHQIFDALMNSPFMKLYFGTIPLIPKYRKRLEEFLASVETNKPIFKKTVADNDVESFHDQMLTIVSCVDNFSFWILALTPNFNSPDDIVSFSRFINFLFFFKFALQFIHSSHKNLFSGKVTF